MSSTPDDNTPSADCANEKRCLVDVDHTSNKKRKADTPAGDDYTENQAHSEKCDGDDAAPDDTTSCPYIYSISQGVDVVFKPKYRSRDEYGEVCKQTKDMYEALLRIVAIVVCQLKLFNTISNVEEPLALAEFEIHVHQMCNTDIKHQLQLLTLAMEDVNKIRFMSYGSKSIRRYGAIKRALNITLNNYRECVDDVFQIATVMKYNAIFALNKLRNDLVQSSVTYNLKCATIDELKTTILECTDRFKYTTLCKPLETQ